MSTESPCIKICKLDDDKVCVGCKRTAKEIATWTKLTEEEKQAILNRINAWLTQR